MAQDHPVLALGRRWADAERAMDAAALDPLLDPDFMAVGPLGFVLSRAQWLERYRSGLHNTAFSWQDVHLRDLGDTAITIGVQDQQTTYQGNDASGRFRISHVFVRRGDQWRIAHIQLSGPLPPQARP
jgi:ketosteroid isomerase-like protein